MPDDGSAEWTSGFDANLIYIHLVNRKGYCGTVRSGPKKFPPCLFDKASTKSMKRGDEMSNEIEEKSGKSKRKNHAGNFDRMLWDKDALKKEIESKMDGEKVNWSEIARIYNVTNKKGEIAKNGGQIVQEWLVNEGVNIHRFKKLQEVSTKPRVRRKKKRGQGGEISIPFRETNDELKEKLKLKKASGEYTVGELIVLRKVII